MDETKTTAEVTVRYFGREDRGQKGRVYTDWSTDEVEPEPTGPLCSDRTCRECNAREARGGTREVDHKVWKAFNRRVIKVWREELVQILADYWGMDALEASTIKVRFSVHAGCSCPCSPGWIIESAHGYRTNFFVKGHRS